MCIQVLESSGENQELFLPAGVVFVFIPHVETFSAYLNHIRRSNYCTIGRFGGWLCRWTVATVEGAASIDVEDFP